MKIGRLKNTVVIAVNNTTYILIIQPNNPGSLKGRFAGKNLADRFWKRRSTTGMTKDNC
jgi:hypothetical protein